MPQSARQRQLEPRAVEAGLETLQVFYQRHVQDVRATVSYVLRRSHGCASDIDDLVQTSFLRFLGAMRGGKIDPGSNVGGYLSTIARHTAHDWMVTCRRERPTPEVGDRLCDQDEHEAHHVTAVRAYLAALPDDVLNVYRLRFDLQLSQLEVARRLSLSRQRVRTLERQLLQGGRRALRTPPPTSGGA